MTEMLLIGPAGSGKGTQAIALSAQLGVPTISTGDLFRSHLAQETALGSRIRSIVDAGELVPDAIVWDVVADRLADDDVGDGFILDGFPRTLGQARTLDAHLATTGRGIQAVVLLEVGRAVLIDRLLVRARSQGRTDDTPEVISRRLDIYDRESEALSEHYGRTGALARIDGEAHPDTVTTAIIAHLEAVAPSGYAGGATPAGVPHA